MKKKSFIFYFFAFSILLFTLFQSCKNKTKCTCQTASSKWTGSIEHIQPGVSAMLTGFYDQTCKFVVYEEFVGEQLVCCIWPPKDKPWPFPFPWPSPHPEPFPFPFDPEDFSNYLIGAISDAPIVIIVGVSNMVIDEQLDFTLADQYSLQIKYNKEVFSGNINIWESPYIEQDFYQFLEKQDKCMWNWEYVDIDFIHKIANSTGFSLNSIGKMELPTDVSFGNLSLWESGYCRTPYIPIEKAKEKSKINNWLKGLCIVATAASDITSLATTALVGSTNVTILKVSENTETIEKLPKIDF